MPDELATLDATAQAERVREKKIEPRELVDAAIDRIERLNGSLNAVVTPLFEKARKAARGNLPNGPFRGVPFLIKDLDTFSAGDPFHGGMQFLKDANYVSPRSSYLVDKLRDAGVVIVGKTNTPELGLSITTEPRSYGPCHNPWHPDHSTGGSSGGSGAAVASGMVPVAHAADGGGSIRIPASECGLVGLKPTRGRISLGPELGEYWHGLVISHVVSRSVRDSAGFLDALSGPMPGDPYVAPRPVRPYVDEVGADPGSLRIGLMLRAPTGAPECDPECREAVERSGRLLESLGHRVETLHPPALDEHELARRLFTVVVASWTAKSLTHWGNAVGRSIVETDVEPETWNLARTGRGVSAETYLTTIEAMHAWHRRVAEWWNGGMDLLVTPTLAGLPPRLGEIGPDTDDPETGIDRMLALMAFTPQFNMTGQPAMSLPLHWSESGLPVGVQFVADSGREDLLLRIAAQLEAAQPWSQRRPGIFA